MPVGGLNREDRRGYVTVMWESEGEVDSATNERTRELWTSRYACRDEPAQATLRETSIAP